MPKTKPPYPEAFKQQIVELHMAGRTPAELSREFGISAQSITAWVARAAAVFVTVLLPLFAALALLANALGWFNHRQWHRSVLGMVGPAIVLVASFTVAEKLLYVGLATMVAVSVWDFVSPANRRCGPDGCAVPPKHA